MRTDGGSWVLFYIESNQVVNANVCCMVGEAFLASSRRGQRSPPSQPAESMLCIILVGCSLCCARARHAEAARSSRGQGSRDGSRLGQRAGRGERVGVVCARACAVCNCCGSLGYSGVFLRFRKAAGELHGAVDARLRTVEGGQRVGRGADSEGAEGRAARAPPRARKRSEAALYLLATLLNEV